VITGDCKGSLNVNWRKVTLKYTSHLLLRSHLRLEIWLIWR